MLGLPGWGLVAARPDPGLPPSCFVGRVHGEGRSNFGADRVGADRKSSVPVGGGGSAWCGRANFGGGCPRNRPRSPPDRPRSGGGPRGCPDDPDRPRSGPDRPGGGRPAVGGSLQKLSPAERPRRGVARLAGARPGEAKNLPSGRAVQRRPVAGGRDGRSLPARLGLLGLGKGLGFVFTYI